MIITLIVCRFRHLSTVHGMPSLGIFTSTVQGVCCRTVLVFGLLWDIFQQSMAYPRTLFNRPWTAHGHLRQSMDCPRTDLPILLFLRTVRPSLHPALKKQFPGVRLQKILHDGLARSPRCHLHIRSSPSLLTQDPAW